MIQIGDTVHLHTTQSKPGEVHPGKVVYIHPLRRYYTVEFSFERMDGVVLSYRESFYFPDRAGASEYKATAMTDAERRQINRIRAHNRIKKRK